MHSSMCGPGCARHWLAAVLFACVRARFRRTYREEECGRAFSLRRACFHCMTQPVAAVIRTNPGDFPSHTSHSHVSPLAAFTFMYVTCHLFCPPLLLSFVHRGILQHVPLSRLISHKLYMISLSSFLGSYITGFFFSCCALIPRGECTGCTSVCVRAGYMPARPSVYMGLVSRDIIRLLRAPF